jgi:hypothetical protein
MGKSSGFRSTIGAHPLDGAGAMMNNTNTVSQAPGPRFAPQTDRRSAQILARTMWKDMVDAGLGREQILAVASELISHVTKDLQEKKDQ